MKKGTKKRYLTVQEFIDTAEKRTDIIIYTERDYHDGLGIRYRCDCKSPVTGLIWDKKEKSLKWEDEDGGPDFYNLNPKTEMKRITSDGEWFTSCYVFE